MPVKARALHSPRLRSPSDASAPSRARAGPRRPLREKTPPHLRRPSPGRCPGIPPPSPPPRHRPGPFPLAHPARRPCPCRRPHPRCAAAYPAPFRKTRPAPGHSVLPRIRSSGLPGAGMFLPAGPPASRSPPFPLEAARPQSTPPARPSGPRRGKTGGKSGKCGPAPRSRKPRTGGPAGGAARAGVWPPAPAPRLRAPRGKHTAGRGRGGFEAGRGGRVAGGGRAAAAEGIPGRRAGRGGFAPAPRFGGRQSENNLFKA